MKRLAIFFLACAIGFCQNVKPTADEVKALVAFIKSDFRGSKHEGFKWEKMGPLTDDPIKMVFTQEGVRNEVFYTGTHPGVAKAFLIVSLDSAKDAEVKLRSSIIDSDLDGIVDWGTAWAEEGVQRCVHDPKAGKSQCARFQTAYAKTISAALKLYANQKR